MTPAGMPDPLAELRGYQLPEPVSWWPPAPGWWLLVLLGLLLIAATVGWMVRRYRLGAVTRAARDELSRLRSAYGRDGDATALAMGLSRLLRRVALSRFPRRRVAGLTGQDWLAFLDEQGGNGRFRDGPGRLLVEAPYRPRDELPVEELVELARDWIKSNRGRVE